MLLAMVIHGARYYSKYWVILYLNVNSQLLFSSSLSRILSFSFSLFLKSYRLSATITISSIWTYLNHFIRLFANFPFAIGHPNGLSLSHGKWNAKSKATEHINTSCIYKYVINCIHSNSHEFCLKLRFKPLPQTRLNIAMRFFFIVLLFPPSHFNIVQCFRILFFSGIFTPNRIIYCSFFVHFLLLLPNVLKARWESCANVATHHM